MVRLMKISDLRRGMSNVDITVRVDDVDEARNVSTKYGNKMVTEATISDETGSAKLTLWEEQIEAVEAGKEYKITGAYVTEFKGEIKLNVPKRGSIEEA